LTKEEYKSAGAEALGVFELNAMGDAFRLAVFTDLHHDIFDPAGAIRAKKDLRRHARNLRPDMLAVLGDTALTTFNKGRTRAFVRLMDSFGLPWTAVLGNHEGERAFEVPRRDVVKMYGASKTFLGKAEIPGVTGCGNQAVVVVRDGSPWQILYFLDSGGGRRGHDHIRQSQLDWMGEVHGLYPGTPGTVFMHVPPYAYQEAYEALSRGEAALFGGALRERVKSGGRAQSAALLAKAGELSVRAFVSGHDHANDFEILWRGMRYIYARCGGYTWCGYDERAKDARGCSVLVYRPDGGMALERH